MPAVDPYSQCPCGSGQKFKWCCHKVETYADRAQRLFDNGQSSAAIEALDEGLRKEPGNPWLLTRKALYLIRQQQPEPAKAALRLVLQRRPEHLGALILMTRLALETEGPEAGAAQFQQALSAFPPEGRRNLATLARVVGAFLSEAARFPAALAHLKLAQQLLPETEDSAAAGLRMIEKAPTVSVWQKNPYLLSPPPDGLPDPARAQFTQALGWAAEGLWSSAASAFELLAADPTASLEADRNLGLCRLWLADLTGAVEALRRFVSRAGTTTEAVDLEALCQQLEPSRSDDLVERVQLIWPLRSRQALLDALRADPSVQEEEPGSFDPDDPEAPDVDQFILLDRPAIANHPDLRIEEIPRLVGRVLVGQEIVALETYDDGRLDALIDRFTNLAAQAIPQAHPRTKVLDKTSRSSLALSWDWLVPEGVERSVQLRLNQEQGAALIRDIWPVTPMPYLGGRTPLQAAEAGDAEAPLRAAIFQLELTSETWGEVVDFEALRSRLRVPPEPLIDPESVAIEQVPLPRLTLVPAERLNDERLAALFRRAREFGLLSVLVRAARALAGRPDSWAQVGIAPIVIHSDLASIVASKGHTAEAFDWVRRGRQADPVAQRVRNAPSWDLLELRIKTMTERPEDWVPELAVILERYGNDAAANQTVILALIDMGLVEMLPNPDRPGDIMIDTRPLQALMAEYGPRVTTASGRLGVSATKGGIWTPGSETGGGGGLWTPGADSGKPSSGGDQPKLIIPGR